MKKLFCLVFFVALLSGFTLRLNSTTVTDTTGTFRELLSRHLDLSKFAEVDGDNSVTVTSSHVTFTNTNSRSATTYVYRDFGVGYFGDYEIQFAYMQTLGNATSSFSVCGLTNTLGDVSDWDVTGQRDYQKHYNYGNDGGIAINEKPSDGAVLGYAGTQGTLYYCTLKRIGTTVYIYVHSDPERATLIGSNSMACTSTKYRYLYVFASVSDASSGQYVSGYVTDVKIIAH